MNLLDLSPPELEARAYAMMTKLLRQQDEFQASLGSLFQHREPVELFAAYITGMMRAMLENMPDARPEQFMSLWLQSIPEAHPSNPTLRADVIRAVHRRLEGQRSA